LPVLWKYFLARYQEIENAIRDTCYGVIFQNSVNSDQLVYYAAMDVTQESTVPEGMQSLQTQSCTMPFLLFKQREVATLLAYNRRLITYFSF